MKTTSTVTPERRYFDATDIHMETRADEDGKESSPVISGYAAVFNEQVEFAGWQFREQIAEGAFTKSIKEDDVRALWNHDSNHPLGRNKAGTLRLSEDEHGLKVEIDPPDTQFARDLTVSIERGDVSQMSFGFFVNREEWESDGEWDNRTILEASLFDVSPVTYPAYPTTEVGVDREEVAFALESRSAWKDSFAPNTVTITTADMVAAVDEEVREDVAADLASKEDVTVIDGEIVDSALSEMKSKQAELEDSITW